MDDKIKKFLYDIEVAINEIESFVKERGRSYSIFVNDAFYQRAVERNIEIIGEAVNRILKLQPAIKITSARKIVDTRNYIIHAYDSLEPDKIWVIVVNHLPKLLEEVRMLLG